MVKEGPCNHCEVRGSVHSIVRDTLESSRKRTSVSPPQLSPIEKLAKDLCSILHEQQSSNLSGSLKEDLLYSQKAMMKSTKRVVMKTSHGTKNPIYNNGSCFCPRSLFASSSDRSCLMQDSFQFTDNSSDQDLLLTSHPIVPSHRQSSYAIIKF
ncbi:hypothetical protein HHK36_000429 [Tetracentron sinense]|uniref:Uncharacterized protein n=1 Tax=Tetracentron sinense TaxID=13715 RepID=A0A834ZVV7_TETSI|nr:hypothetical protein HHK36_000429 [Tetracentron sinense]